MQLGSGPPGLRRLGPDRVHGPVRLGLGLGERHRVVTGEKSTPRLYRKVTCSPKSPAVQVAPTRLQERSKITELGKKKEAEGV
jgi:hypothetical protein